MDTSVQSLDMVKFVLGEDLPLARWDDITDEQRLQIVAAVIQRVRPLLKVLPGFKILREWVEEKIGHSMSEVTEFYGRLSLDAHCRFLIEVKCSPTRQLPEGDTERQLLFTDRDGNWLLIAVRSRQASGSTVSSKQPQAYRLSGWVVSEDQFMQIASKHGRDVYLALNEVLNLAISYWSHRIVDCEEVRDWIADIDSRVM